MEPKLALPTDNLIGSTYVPIGPQPEFEPLPSLDETEPLFTEYFEVSNGSQC